MAGTRVPGYRVVLLLVVVGCVVPRVRRRRPRRSQPPSQAHHSGCGFTDSLSVTVTAPPAVSDSVAICTIPGTNCTEKVVSCIGFRGVTVRFAAALARRSMECHGGRSEF
eukprot:3082542-Rhodomonas_salina.2